MISVTGSSTTQKRSMQATGLGQCSLDYLCLVDTYPAVDTKKEVHQWHEQDGGPVATALVVLCSLGIDCCFYGIVGDDPEGAKIRQSLMQEGIDIKGLLKRKGSSSQQAVIVVEEKTARRTIFWSRPSGEALEASELGPDFLPISTASFRDGILKASSGLPRQSAP